MSDSLQPHGLQPTRLLHPWDFPGKRTGVGCQCLLRVKPLFVAILSLNRVQLYATSWTAACQASLSFTISQSLLKLMSIESVLPSNHLILCHPLLFLPSIFPSIRVFSDESALLIRWPKYWSFSISPSNEYSGLISFRMDWFDLLAVHRTLESSSAPQFKSIDSSVLSLLYNELLCLYMTTGKTIALTIRTFVSKADASAF